jgi:hypothetical protein
MPTATAKPGKLSHRELKALSDHVHKTCRGYHQSIPLAFLQAGFESFGISMEEFILCGHEGRATINLHRFDLETGEVLASIENSMLVLMWYKMESGNYEVTAYLS